MKNKPLIITLIVLLLVIAISLVGFMVRVMTGSFKFKFSGKVATELIVDKTYDEKIDKLNIKSSQGNIEIISSNDDEVRLVIYGEEELTDYKLDRNELEVTMKSKPCIAFCFNIDIPRIIVYLPKDFAGEIELNDKYGDIEVGEFANAIINIENDCGDVEVKAGNTVTIEDHYGDIKLVSAIDGTITNDCGDIRIGKLVNAKLKNHYGDIKIDEITSHADIHADCGDIEIDELFLTKDSKITNNLGNIQIRNTNEIYISAKTSLGDTNIRNNYREADVELTIENSCGDIDVKN